MYFVALGSLFSTTAIAAKQSLDVQIFHLAPDAQGFFTTESGNINPHKHFNISLLLNYASNPLEVRILEGTSTTETLGVIVKNRLDFVMMAAIGFGDVIELALSFPVLWQGGYESESFNQNNVNVGLTNLLAVTQGDLRLQFKWRVFKNEKIAFGMVDNFSVPTGASSSYATEASFAFEHMFALTAQFLPQLRAGINVGYRFRNRTEIQSLVVDDEITFKTALGYTFFNRPNFAIEGITEFFGQTSVDHPFAFGTSGLDEILRRVRTPLELDVGVRAKIAGNYHLLAGTGLGLSTGYGAPLPRVFIGFTYAPITIDDKDHDGIPDKSDQCVNDPEDRDNFEDTDGCPDLDNDKDGVRDAVDKCPTVKEDKDNFKDDDGCPEIDNDNDGIIDEKDKCPNDPEDRDGVEDTDGCPDTEKDKDHDGILDAVDKCPSDPEDKDGVEDTDGCPEDNDNDGVPDNKDECPNEAETYNLLKDEDGCPEKDIPSFITVTKDKIELSVNIKFEVNKAILSTESLVVLDQLYAALHNFTNIRKVRIEGHTDIQGIRANNLVLSQARADSVKKYLVDKGIDAKRLDTIGYGPDKPIASNKTAKGRDKNRRVDIFIVEQGPSGTK